MIAGNLLPAVLERYHIIIELTVPEAFVTPEQVSAAVVINKYGGVDETESLGQGAAYGIGPGALRVIGHSHSQGVTTGGLVAAHVPVPFAVTLHALASPGTLSLTGPLERGGIDLGTQIGPVDHVIGAEQGPVLHIEVTVTAVLVMICKKIYLVTIYERCRVRCKHCADYGVLGRCQNCHCSSRNGQ